MWVHQTTLQSGPYIMREQWRRVVADHLKVELGIC